MRDTQSVAVVGVVVGGDQNVETGILEGRCQLIGTAKHGVTGVGRRSRQSEFEVADRQISLLQNGLDVLKTGVIVIILGFAHLCTADLRCVAHNIAGEEQVQRIGLCL